MKDRLRTALASDFVRFSILEFAYWFAMSVGNYQTVYLQQQGFTASSLGLINAVVAAATIGMTPLWGMVSDRIRSVRKVFLITLACGHLLFAFLPGVVTVTHGSVAAAVVWLGLTYAFRNPANSLLDNWLVFTANQKRLNYGFIRCFGSIGFTVCGLLIAGWVSRGVTATFPVDAALMALVVLWSLRIDDCRPAPRMPGARFDPRELFKDRHYVMFLLFAFLVWIAVNSISAFMPYLLEDLGIPGSRYGVISAFVAAFEVPMLLTAAPLRSRVPLYALTLAGAACYATSTMLLGTVAASFVSVLLIEGITGLGSGLLVASAANYVYSMVPERLKATGQAVYIAITAMAGIVGNLLAGTLIDTIGARPFYRVLSFIALSAIALFTVALSIDRHRAVRHI